MSDARPLCILEGRRFGAAAGFYPARSVTKSAGMPLTSSGTIASAPVSTLNTLPSAGRNFTIGDFAATHTFTFMVLHPTKRSVHRMEVAMLYRRSANLTEYPCERIDVCRRQ